ncbi:PaaI family thioesterase [Mycolicibacterium neoaurum]|uniref:PaaI family thioesterase n=1 Tax=Mycolicibacterium neoaurum TaxID=1795 RepID=UPI00248B2006|nr:PaaI family thioesterase [Mycolicibacterium neoaurum]WBP92916.1 PaaI family thioesterase [Mycolicibacterium neoaurum]WBS08052.1 PaaI family thioesterase [Mycolicibacterium neoaurum]
MSYPLNTPTGRFGIHDVEQGPTTYSAALPVAAWRNPFTGAPSMAALGVLVDHIAGYPNHARRPDGRWTVTSELTIEFCPGAHHTLTADNAAPIVATSRTLGVPAGTSLSVCDLTHDGRPIGHATIRSFYIEAASGNANLPHPEPDADTILPTELSDLLAVEVAEAGGAAGDARVLRQHAHPAINNHLGAVHGGIVAAGLELVAAAALNSDPARPPLHTASLRINYLRRLIGGGQAHYRGTALHAGRSSGVAEAQGIDADGRLALTARLTAYRD